MTTHEPPGDEKDEPEEASPSSSPSSNQASLAKLGEGLGLVAFVVIFSAVVTLVGLAIRETTPWSPVVIAVATMMGIGGLMYRAEWRRQLKLPNPSRTRAIRRGAIGVGIGLIVCAIVAAFVAIASVLCRPPHAGVVCYSQ